MLGMAVFVFGYSNFGTSEGEFGNIVNSWWHLHDWKAAISHVRKFERVDGSRRALRGTSFSGGRVIVTAAWQNGIRAAVAEVPFVDGIATTMQFSIPYQLEGIYHGIRDLLSMVKGIGPPADLLVKYLN